MITPIWIVLQNNFGKWGGWKAITKPYKQVYAAVVPKPIREAVGPMGDWAHENVQEPVQEAASKAGEASWDYTVGPKNPISSALDSFGAHKAAGLTAAPSWDELGKPGEAFVNNFDEQAGILPPSWRQYAEPAVATLLNFVPGVGPLLSAGFSTAYNAGNMQRNQKGMDWGKVGIDAAKNFGTAAAQMGAAKLAANANAAQSANTAAKATQTAANSSDLASNLASGVGQAAGAGTGASLGAAIPQGYNLATTGSTIGAGSALAAFKAHNSPSGGAQSSIPTTSSSAPQAGAPANKGALSSFGDTAYNQAVKSAPGLASNVASTLAPTGNTALSGFDSSSLLPNNPVPDGYQFGDELKAFRDPSATGGISSDELNNMTMKIGYNNFQQKQGARDTYLPSGQTEPEPNTPYSGKLNQIDKGTEKSYEDLLREVDNANAIQKIQDANPTFSIDEINAYIKDPTLTPETFRPWLQGLQPMDNFNTGLMR